MKLKRKAVGVVALIVLGVAATGGYALTSGFTNSNTINAQYVGSGTNTASGYTVSNIVYTFDNSNLANVDAVEFDLDHNADDAEVQVTKTLGVPSGTIYNCTLTGTVSAGGKTLNAAANHPVCSFGAGGIANSGITDLTVAATIKTS